MGIDENMQRVPSKVGNRLESGQWKKRKGKKAQRESIEKEMRLEKIKEKKLELQELRENLWRWREGGGGRKKDGKEKKS